MRYLGLALLCSCVQLPVEVECLAADCPDSKLASEALSWYNDAWSDIDLSRGITAIWRSDDDRIDGCHDCVGITATPRRIEIVGTSPSGWGIFFHEITHAQLWADGRRDSDHEIGNGAWTDETNERIESVQATWLKHLETYGY